MTSLKIKDIVYSSVVFVICLQAFTVNGKAKKTTNKCATCKDLVKNFDKGLERTSKFNYGGGDTDWEETRLSSYATSETRLIEISDELCESTERECHTFLEEHEETVESWWFKHYPKKGGLDLVAYLCINEAAVCCPNGTYGPDCTDCPGGRERYCTGNGQCVGEGTREGTGTCDCDAGYQGDMCNECKDGFYEGDHNDTHISCLECHKACLNTCWEEGPKGCDDCKAGWNQEEEKGCVDINECDAETPPCKDNEYCTNNEGSYRCSVCNRGCQGCTNEGLNNCIECADRFFNQDGTCVECHESCENSCTGPERNQCDACKTGWLLQPEEGCVDENECETRAPACGINQYCTNNEGSFKCTKCDKSCRGCTGPADTECIDCMNGYTSEEGKCIDIDECSTDASPCSKENERCSNSPGSYKCSCMEGFVRVGGDCEKKEEKPKKVKKKKKEKKAKKKSDKDETEPSDLAQPPVATEDEPPPPPEGMLPPLPPRMEL